MKTNNKTSKFKAKISTVQEGNQEQSAEDLLRCERIKKLERKKDAPKVDRRQKNLLLMCWVVRNGNATISITLGGRTPNLLEFSRRRFRSIRF
jgi:hypothetical protein